MTLKELILELLASTHNQDGWFATVMDAITDLTAAQAAQKSSGLDHSIWQIVNHLTFWNERWLMRFKGVTTPKMEADNKSTFSIKKTEITQQNWELAVKRIDEIMTEWYDAVKNKSEEELAKPVVQGEKDSWYSYIATLAMHNAYHIGQIVTLRKMQGSWEPDMGVAT